MVRFGSRDTRRHVALDRPSSLLTLAVLSLSLSSFAAAGCTEDPLSPAFDEMTVVLDDEVQQFDETVVRASTVDRFEFCGLSDPDTAAADDEVALCLSLELDDAALEQISSGESRIIEGTTTIGEGSGPGTLGAVSYEPGPNQSAPLTSALVELECNCTDSGSHTQFFTGSLRVDALADDSVTVSFNVEMTGDIPFDGPAGQRHIEFVGQFALDRF